MKISNEFIDIFLKNLFLERIDNYIGANNFIRFKCLICNYIWRTRFNRIKNEGKRCPSCQGLVKLTNEKVDDLLVNLPIKRVDNYINIDAKIKFECQLCEYIWEAIPYNVIYAKSGCPNCAGNAKLSNEILDKKLKNKPLKRIGEYINLSTSIEFQCLNCGFLIKTSPGNIIHKGTGCPLCYGNIKYSNLDIDNKLLNSQIQRVDDYINYHTHIHFKCLQCDYLWKTAPASILFAGSGCPKCNAFKNEKLIYDFLASSNVKFEYQFPLNKIISGYEYKYVADFYFKDKNIIIEYNGRQHYEPVCFGGISFDEAKINFNNQVIRDKRLEEFCATHLIKLFFIDGREYKDLRLKKYLQDLLPLLI